MSTRESRRIQHLRRRVVRLERELAALKAEQPPIPLNPPMPSMYYRPWQVPGQLPVYPANPTPIIITDTSQPYTVTLDTSATCTTLPPIIFNTQL